MSAQDTNASVENSPVEKVGAALKEHGAAGEVVRLAVDVPTAQAAAAELGCPVAAIANSLIFAAVHGGDEPDEPVLILTSGAHRVDTKRVARMLGVRKLKRADPDFVYEATGQRVGGVAPVGHPRRLRTLVDVRLREHETVWAAAGEAHTVFPTSFDELVALTGGTPAEVGRPTEEASSGDSSGP